MKSTKKFEFIIETVQEIDRFLLSAINSQAHLELSRKQIQKLFLENLVLLDGKIEKFRSKKLKIGQSLEVHLPKVLFSKKSPLKPVLEIDPKRIIFEDNILIIYDKPEGIPTQGTLDPKKDHLYASLQRFLDQREKKKTYLALHHRLDTDTSGLIIFCKKKSFNKKISDMFQNKTIKKTYLALVNKNIGSIPPTLLCEERLEKIREGRFLKSKVCGDSVGESAKTTFKLINSQESSFLLECYPETGRMHQIRVHLQNKGFPIVGDRIYGGSLNQRLMLHAWKLNFLHPSNDKLMEVLSPIPVGFL